jgi:hypothetical protein
MRLSKAYVRKQITIERSILMDTMIPEVDEIVNFHSSELVEGIARETGFVQRESKLGGVEFHP